MRHAVAALLVLAASPLTASATEPKSGDLTVRADPDHRPCQITLGPRDRLAQDADLVIPAGAEVESAVALRGSVIVQRGARVKKAVTAGGSVRVEGSAQVAEGGTVAGSVVALSLQVGDFDLERLLREQLRAQGKCRVEQE